MQIPKLTPAQAVPHLHDPATLQTSVVARLPFRSSATGQLRWPALPALVDHYAKTLLDLFAGLGRPFAAEEQASLRKLLALHTGKGYEASPYSRVVIDYHLEPPPSSLIVYEVSHETPSQSDKYEEWVQNRKPPLFGAHPDAKVLSLAYALGTPERTAVLDIGAGTGRNTLPLAKAGFQVDAIEMAPSLAVLLREEIARAGATTTVYERDALDPQLNLPENHYQLIFLAEVTSDFHDASQLPKLFERVSRWLAPGGLLLFTMFLPRDGFVPDALARQASRAFWSMLFTRDELDAASSGSGLVRVSDESAHNFEHQHLAKEAWPPTGWYPDWSRGYDVYQVPKGRPPLEMRWMVYRKPHDSEQPPAKHLSAVTTHIAAPRDKVFDAAVDPTRVAKIFKPLLPLAGIRRTELSTVSAPTATATREVTWSDGSHTTEEILELDPPFRHTYRWTNTLKGPFALLFRSAEASWMFAPTPTGTAVYWSYRFEARNRYTEPMMNIVVGAFRRWMQASLQHLREQLER